MPVGGGSIQLFKVLPFCPKYQFPQWLGCCFSSKCVFYPRFIFFEIETFQCYFLSLLYPTFPDAHKEQYTCRKRSLDDFFLWHKRNQESVCNLGNGVNRVLKERRCHPPRTRKYCHGDKAANDLIRVWYIHFMISTSIVMVRYRGSWV